MPKVKHNLSLVQKQYSLIGIHPIKDWVLVDIYDTGSEAISMKSSTGKTVKLWRPSDSDFGFAGMKRPYDSSHPGIRGRWARVMAVNEHSEKIGLRCGQKVFLDQLKWTRGFVHDPQKKLKVWGILHTDILLVDEHGFNDWERELLTERYGSID